MRRSHHMSPTSQHVHPTLLHHLLCCAVWLQEPSPQPQPQQEPQQKQESLRQGGQAQAAQQQQTQAQAPVRVPLSLFLWPVGFWGVNRSKRPAAGLCLANITVHIGTALLFAVFPFLSASIHPLCRRRSCNVRPLGPMAYPHRYFQAVFVLLVLSQAFRPAVARLVEDSSFGITRYDFRGVWGNVPGILTVYLRPICIGRTLFVRGVMGVITVKMEADSSDGYTAPAALVDYNWSLRLVDRSTNSSTKVRVYKTVDRGERTLTYSQLEAQLQVPNQLDLFVEGSPWRHELYLPDCVLSEDSEEHPLKQMPGGLFNDKHWLVVMLPRTLPVPMAQYSQLLLSHMRYHQGLGFAGTLLLCDLHQAHELTQLQEVNAALEQDSLLMWPWVRWVLRGGWGGAGGAL